MSGERSRDGSTIVIREDLSNLRASDVVITFVSDLHLSAKAPVARAEKDWYGVQKRYLDNFRDVAESFSKAVVVYGGDVFDDGWRPQRCPPELINFAMENLPWGYSIPGQHDLPYHRYEDIQRSAYWTLVKGGILNTLPAGKPKEIKGWSDVWLYGFPWKIPIRPPMNKDGLHIAVVHGYVWDTEKNSYPGASHDAHTSKWQKKLAGYDVALFGDNHRGFYNPGGVKILNHGTFMLRKADEYGYQPRIGLVTRDGDVFLLNVDTSKDEWNDLHMAKLAEQREQVDKEVGADISGFVKELAKLGDQALNFGEAVRRFLEKECVSDSVRKMVVDSMGES